jgi:hypothetical protein
MSLLIQKNLKTTTSSLITVIAGESINDSIHCINRKSLWQKRIMISTIQVKDLTCVHSADCKGKARHFLAEFAAIFNIGPAPVHFLVQRELKVCVVSYLYPVLPTPLGFMYLQFFEYTDTQNMDKHFLRSWLLFRQWTIFPPIMEPEIHLVQGGVI